MGIWKTFFNNTRKPEGLLGRCMVDSMNHAHAALADWGLSRLPETGPSQIAELGCGGGRNIRALLRKYPAATITALDYSEISVEKAKRVNREGLQAGRCQILQGDVSRLPFGDGSFDLATAFETVYFWPDLPRCFREVWRVLKPGGTFFICNESNGDTDKDEKWTKIINGMTIYQGTELKAYLEQAGFHEVQIHKNKAGWLCVTARK